MLSVSADHQRRGIASALIEATMERSGRSDSTSSRARSRAARRLHREDDPAVIHANGSVKYYVDGA
jgi:ribosomal protein S18 acetylase RimI-like enzyme